MEKVEVEKLLDQAEKQYLLEGGDSFKFSIRHTRSVRENFPAFESNLKRFSFLRITAFRNIRQGSVRVARPSEICIYLPDLLRMRPELRTVRECFEQAKKSANRTKVDEFIRINYAECRRKFMTIKPVVEVLEYIMDNRETIAGKFPREIPHRHSTKIIGHERLLLRLFRFTIGTEKSRTSTWKEFLDYFALRTKPISFQFYASSVIREGLRLNGVHGIINQDNLPKWDLCAFRAALIVENEESFLALRDRFKDCLILFGGGDMIGAGDFLKDNLPPLVLYWGDIDAAGYEILARVHEMLNNVEPVCMSMSYIYRYRQVRVPREHRRQSGESPAGEIQILNREYQFVRRFNISIEQEKLSIDDVVIAVNSRLYQSG